MGQGNQDLKGPKNEPIYLNNLFQTDVFNSISDNPPINIFNTLYPDANPTSGVCYYLPAFYAINWNQNLKSYDFQVTYGEDRKTRVTAILRPKTSKTDLDVSRDLLSHYLRGKTTLNGSIKELRPMTTKQDLEIIFTSNLSQFGIDAKDVSIRAPSDFFDAIYITFTTSNIDDLMGMFFNNIGLYGDVVVYPSGEGMPEKIRIPFYLKIQSSRTYGKMDLTKSSWASEGWQNKTDYPLVINSLNVLMKEASGFRVYSWKTDQVEVNEDEKILFGNVPKTLADNYNVPLVWLDYSLKDCQYCNIAVKDSIIQGIRPDQQVQPMDLNIIVLSPIAFTKASQIKLKIRSTQTNLEPGPIRDLPPITIREDLKDLPGGRLYVREKIGLQYDYMIQVIMPNGQKHESSWIHGTDQDIILGEFQLREHIDHFKNLIAGNNGQ